jgi:NADH-quinone oxidoreductase subunit G
MALLNVATRLRLGDRAGAGLLEIPAATNARGLREAGVLPGAGPGLANARGVGHSAQEMAAALAEGELTTLYLLGDDPLRTRADRELWQRAYRRATTIIAHASVLTEGLREHATVVFPSEAYAEKEGTVTHPDGRIQRLRPAIGHAGEVRTEWTILADIARRLGLDLGVLTGPMATAQLAGAVPFYAGLTLEELGGRGVRWQDRDAAASAPVGAAGPFELEHPPRAAGGDDQGRLRLGTFRSIWASPECEVSPALKFLHPTQKLELSPADAQRLGIANGDPVLVGSNGTRVRGVAVIRAAVPEGSAFLEDGLEHDGANALTNGVPPLVEVMRA